MMNARQLLQQQRPLVIAHRGFSQLAPENTRSSFEMAIAAGADCVELDYRHSADGVALLLHDQTLNRTTNATQQLGREGGTVESYPAAPLQNLDAGSWFHPRFAGEKLLRLDEALNIICPHSVALIERKSGTAQMLCDLLQSLPEATRAKVVAQSFDWEFVAQCRALDSTLILGALGPNSSASTLNEDALWQIAQLGAQLVVWNREVDAAAIQRAHELDLQVWIYTINTLDEALDLLRIGVDGLISDNPALIWKALALHPASAS